MSKKYTQEYMNKYFKEQECELLEEYVNAHTKMKYRCSCGNINEISWNSFQQGHRCMLCSGTPKYSQEYVNQTFLNAGCKCLDVYKNTDTPLNYICVCGNKSKIAFKYFKKGQRCKECGYKKNSQENNWNWKLDREQIRINEKITKATGRILKRILTKTNIKKYNSYEKRCGYNSKQLLEHLQKQSLYKNWVNDTRNYHIHHIIPVSKFLKNNITDPKIINALDNLTILTKKDNLKLHDKCDDKDFIKYIENKNIILERVI